MLTPEQELTVLIELILEPLPMAIQRVMRDFHGFSLSTGLAIDH
jgi:hypothetical protein